MKPAHLIPVIAAAAMLGGHAVDSQPVKATAETGPLDKPFAKLKGRWHPNQKQIRKDRRRAFANGNRKAFA